jgi:two-component system LytT family sensor kinase
MSKLFKNTGKFPLLRFSLVVMIVYTVYPLLFAYLGNETSLVNLFKDLAYTWGIGIFFTFFIVYLVKYGEVYFHKVGPIRYWLEWLFVCIVSYYFILIVYKFRLSKPISTAELLDMVYFRLYLVENILGVSFIYLLNRAFYFYQSALEKAAFAEKLQKEYAEMRLQVLKSQINPHFLFNSLSVLSNLVHVDKDASEKFILQLSKAYRYILDQKNEEWVSLEKELAFLDTYFYLLQIRFNKKVCLNMDIRVNADEWLIPALTLQLLVENVVKHNSMSTTHPLCIDVTAMENKIIVRNSINKREHTEKSTGIGLQNIARRVAYRTTSKVEIEKNDQFFSISVPLIAKLN